MDGDGSSPDKRKETWIAVAYGLLFASIAPLTGYLSLYLQRRGLTNSQIGSAVAVAALVSIISPPLWGYLSDRWHNRRLPLIIISLGSAIAFAAYFGASFPSVLLIAASFAFFNSPLIPLLDALVLERLGGAKERYGRLRAWGSWAFIGMMLLFGMTLKRHGDATALFPVLGSFILLRLLLSAAASQLPRNGGGKPMGAGDGRALRELFTDRRWLAFLLVSSISMVSNGFFYPFFPLYLNKMGVSDNWQGYFWVIAVLAEVAFMAWLAEPLIKRIGLKGVLLLGIMGRAIRYGAYAFPLSFPLLLALQLFHALTFAATHTSSVTWVSMSAPPQARALTQTLYTSVLMGVGLAFGAQLGGFVSEHWGLPAMFGLAGTINFVALLLGWRWLTEPMPLVGVPIKRDVVGAAVKSPEI